MYTYTWYEEANPEIVFQTALRANAFLVLFHSHPPGTLSLSRSDENIIQKFKEGGSLHDITVLNHIILTSENYLPMADEGYI